MEYNFFSRGEELVYRSIQFVSLYSVVQTSKVPYGIVTSNGTWLAVLKGIRRGDCNFPFTVTVTYVLPCVDINCMVTGLWRSMDICHLNMQFLCIKPISVSACHSRINRLLDRYHIITIGNIPGTANYFQKSMKD